MKVDVYMNMNKPQGDIVFAKEGTKPYSATYYKYLGYAYLDIVMESIEHLSPSTSPDVAPPVDDN